MEYIKNGTCLQEKEVNDRCPVCGEKFFVGVYRTDRTGKRMLKIIRCKKCNTASVLKK